MANELRLRADLVAGALTADISIGGVTMHSGGLADLPVVDSTNHAAITLFQTDVDGRVVKKEIVYVTSHTAAATTATIVKAEEGTTDQAWNGTSAPDKWVHAATLRDTDAGRVQMVKMVSGPQPTFTSTTTWQTASATLDLTIPAYAGDLLEYGINGLWNNDATGGKLDIATVVSGSIVNYVGNSGGAGDDGIAAWYGQPTGGYVGVSGSVFYVVQAGDIDSGDVLMRLVGRIQVGGTGTKILLTATDDPLFVWVKNHGPQAA